MSSLLLSLALIAQAAAPVDRMLEQAQRVWLCPLHPELHHDEPGTCEVCRRPHVEKTVGYRWACPMHADVDTREDGVCASSSRSSPR